MAKATEEKPRDPLQDAAEDLVEQLIQKGQSARAKEQALLDLLTAGKEKPS